MNQVENSVIKYQIDFEKYKNGQSEQVIKLLDEANKKISAYIKQTDGVYTKVRYKEISKKLREVSAALKESSAGAIDIDAVIDYELKKQKKVLKKTKKYFIKDENINFLYPSLEQIKTAALFKPVDTKYALTYQSFLDGIETGLYNTWDSAIRTGYLTGLTTQKIVSSVMGGISPYSKLKTIGSINALRNSIYSNTRTVLQSFASETQRQVYEANEKYLGNSDTYKFEYLATLDSRTCLVCGNLDGKLFKTIKDVPQLPLHRGCRCTIVPYYEIEGETKSSKNGYTGADTSFSHWLKEQDSETQKEVLGATRYKLYKNGTEIKDFVDNGNIFSIKQLSEKLNTKGKFDNLFKNLAGIEEEKVKEDLKKISKEQLDLLSKYVDEIDIDFHFNGTAFQKGKKVFCNISKVDSRSLVLGYKTNITTFLHESGHWLDFNMLKSGETIHSKLPDLRKKIKQDILNYCNNKLQLKEPLKSIKDITDSYQSKEKIRADLMDNSDMKNGVSDIFSGITKNKLTDGWIHATSYWKGEHIECEIIAHFFEARGSIEKLKILKQYFPSSYDYFESLLRSLEKNEK